MAYLLASSGGGLFIPSVVADRVYDPVYDTPMDAQFIYQLLPSFYRDLMDDKELFSTAWSGLMQQAAADILNLWQIDYAKSLSTIPTFSQRKWLGLPFTRAYGFDTEPEITRSLSAAAYFPWNSGAIDAKFVTRSRTDSATYVLRRPVTEWASLEFSVEVNVKSADKFSASLYGYEQALSSGQQANFLGVALLGSESVVNSPRIACMFIDASGLPSLSFAAFPLTTDTDYRIDFTYTASSTAAVLTLTELLYLRHSGANGFTGGDSGETLTNFLIDESVNFETLGIQVGDTLYVLGMETRILTVDGHQLGLDAAQLPAFVDNTPYSIRGPQLVSSALLDLEGSTPSPAFIASRFGMFSLDQRSTTTSVFSNLAVLRDKTMQVTTKNWSFLDPSFSEDVTQLPRLQDTISNPVQILTEGTDYYLSKSTVFFQEPPGIQFWAEYVGYDEGYIQDNFGINVGLSGESSDEYKARVRGLYYAYWRGPTLSAIRQGVHILIGLPIAAKAGVVEAINNAYSGTLGTITVAGLDYIYPLSVGTSLQIGDVVQNFQPLCNGVEIVDYIVNPSWFANLNFSEIQKFHSFLVRLNIDVFILDTLRLSSQFLARIKPTWKDYLLVAHKDMSDIITVDDDILMKVTLHAYDQPYDEVLITYDSFQYGSGGGDWLYDQGLAEWEAMSFAMETTSTLLLGSAAFANGSNVITGLDTTWATDLGVGAVSNVYVAMSVHSSGTEAATGVGSNYIGDEAAGFGTLVVGDKIWIDGQGEFEVILANAPNIIRVDRPATATATGLAWYAVGSPLFWAQVTSVTDDNHLVLNSNFPYTSGTYALSRLSPEYKDVYYDQFEESGPDEDFTIVITYTGAGTVTGKTVPAASGSTTHDFLFDGAEYAVTLTERVHP